MAIYPLTHMIRESDFPLSEHLSITDGVSFFNRCYYKRLICYSCNTNQVIDFDLLIKGNVSFSLPFFDIVSLTIGEQENNTTFFNTSLGIGAEPYLDVRDVPVKISIAKEVLQPVDDHKQIIPNQNVLIELGRISFYVDINGISLQENIEINIPFCMIGQTGILVELSGLNIKLLSASPSVSFNKCKIVLPDLFLSSEGLEINMENTSISATGFSGSCSVDIPLTEDSNIFGIPGGLKHVEIVIENNQPTTFILEGELTIPYFDTPVDVFFGIDENGDITATIKNLSNEPFTKDELVSLYLQSMELKKEGSVGSLSLSGSLQPLLFAKDGLKWPKMDVRNLRIDTNGKLSIDEAWMDLREISNLDLWGFHLELRKLGFGVSTDERMWLDLSGSIRLVEQLPLGLDMEGFRISWPTNINPGRFLNDPQGLMQELQKIQVQFRGIDIKFAIPKTVKIDGLIRFFKDAQKVGFAGDMKLAVIPAGFTAEAGMMIGMNTATPVFPFVYVYFGFESTAGIPLAQTGLALKGAMGLIGINVAPNKKEGADWYHDWYKGAPGRGAHQTTKWTDHLGGFAIGIGVTISTADGVVKKTSGLLVLSFPGPFLLINGAAFLLDTGAGDGEPPFTATAIFADNNIKFVLEAQAEIIKDMISASAYAEAFFDLDDITNWHLYLGVDQPESRRVRADVLNIFNADAYLMLDMIDADSPRMRAGVFISIRPDIPTLEIKDPWGNDLIKIIIEAWLYIDGTGQVSINPEQFSGKVSVDGGLTVSAFGFTFGPTVKAELDIDGPTPFRLKGYLDFTLKMWPEDYNNKAEIDFEADFRKKTRKTPKLTIIDPVQSIISFCRFKDDSPALTLYGSGKGRQTLPENLSVDEKRICELSPIVAVDSNPVIAFNQAMNNDSNNTNMKFIMHPGGRKKYKTGRIEMEATVTRVEIFRKKKTEPWRTNWEIIYATSNSGSLANRYNRHNDTYSINLLDDLWGTWLADADPQSPAEPGSRRLQLLTANPLVNTAHSYTMEGASFMTAATANAHLSARVLEDYPGLMFEPAPRNNSRCVKFNIVPGTVARSNDEGKLVFRELLFICKEGMEINACDDIFKKENCYCLNVAGMLDIYFPGEIESCTITYCQETDKKNELHDIETTDKDKKPDDQKKDPNQKAKYPKETVMFFDAADREITNIHFERGLQNTYNNPARPVKWIRITANPFSIYEICYTLKQEAVHLPEMPSHDPQQILDPGYYYKIHVTSLLAGKVEDKIKPEIPIQGYPYTPALKIPNPEFTAHNEALKSALNINNDSNGPHERTFLTAAYFQTSAPPNNLERYVKWTFPNQVYNRICTNDDLLICFNRGYLGELFNGRTAELRNFEMTAFITDANNKVYPRQIRWERSGSSTRFQEEETWDRHLDDNGSTISNRKDDLIVIGKSGSIPLPANQRCNLIITGGNGGKTLIPPMLPGDEMGKYWKDFSTEWDYTSDGILSSKGSGKREIMAIDEDYENVEINFETRSSNFDFIFRCKKIGNVLACYKVSIENDQRIKIGLYSNNILIQHLFCTSAAVDWSSGSWQFFKIRVVNNEISIFKGYKREVNRFDFSSLHAATEREPRMQFDIRQFQDRVYSMTGSAGIGTGGGEFRNIEFRDAELLRIPFYTTGSSNLKELYSISEEINMVEAGTGHESILSKIRSDAVPKLRALGEARLACYLVQKDYEYNMARYPLNGTPQFTSREAVEKFMLELREKEKELDAFFKETLLLHLFPQQMFYLPEKGINISLLYRKDQSGARTAIALYIQSRERLFPKPLSGTKDPYALTEVSVSIGNKNLMLENGLVFNSDGDQLVVLLNEPDMKDPDFLKKITIELNTSLVNSDQVSPDFFGERGINEHHRYDRNLLSFYTRDSHH